MRPSLEGPLVGAMTDADGLHDISKLYERYLEIADLARLGTEDEAESLPVDTSAPVPLGLVVRTDNAVVE